MVFGSAFSISNAQEIQRIEKLTELPGSFQQINEIQQDSVGNLWIASDDHVQRYNSFFTEYYSRFKGMPENAGKINTIFIDSRNRIWAGMKNGLFQYASAENIFVEIPSERTHVENDIQQIAEDENGKIWIGANTGIWNFSENKLVLIAPFPSTQMVNKLAPVDQRIVFGTSRGLFSLNKSSREYKKIPLSSNDDFNVSSILFAGEYYLVGTKEDGLLKIDRNFSNPEKIFSLPFSTQQTQISDLSIDEFGNIYVASNGDGLLILDKNLKLKSHYLHEEGNNLSLSNNSLNSLYLDKYNTLWVATESGQINSINLKQNNFVFLRHDPKKYSSLADNFTTAIEKDKNGNVWFGTRQGLSVWNRSEDTWRNIKNLSTKKESKVPDIIRDIQADDLHMWVATFNDGLYKIDINSFIKSHFSPDASNPTNLKKVNALLVDSNKNLWAGGEEGSLTRISRRNEIKSFDLQGISAMVQLANGDILAAGKNGVFSINKESNSFQSIQKLAPNTKNLPYFNINAITEAPSGDIVFATEGAGIVIYNPANGALKVVDEKYGLPSNRVHGLLIYGKNDIWAGTSKGLVNFMMEETPKIRVFDKDDGLLSDVFTRRSFAQLENKLAFGTLKGVSVFNPINLKSKVQTVPNILFGSLHMKSKNKGTISVANFKAGSQLEFANSENSFNIKFYGITPSDFSQVVYSWKLDGFDEDWTAPSSQNEANYANLASGDYRFLVKAKTANGRWSAAKTVSINIAAPWWASTTAALLYLILLLALIAFALYYFRIYKKERNKNIPSANHRESNKSLKTEMLTSEEALIKKPIKEVKSKEDKLTTNPEKNIDNSLYEGSQPFMNTKISERNSNLLKGGLDNKFIEHVKSILMQHIEDSNFTAQDLSKAVGMTNNAFYLKLKKHTGLIPLDFILRTKLDYAKALINNGAQDLLEVSEKAGFQNKDIFAFSFKKHFGYFPETFIERNKPTK